MDIGQYLFHKSIYDPLLFILSIAVWRLRFQLIEVPLIVSDF